MFNFHFNGLYKKVFAGGFSVFDICGGRGRGGSHFSTDYFLYRITHTDYFRGYFMRFIHSDIRGSLYQDFRDRVEEHEEIDERDFDFNDSRLEIVYRPTGNKILSKGFRKSQGSATAKLKSIAGATDIIIEECEEISEDDFNKLQDSLRTVKAELHIFRIWNPPQKDHWLVKNFYDLVPHPEYDGYFIAKAKKIEDFISVWSTYKDNAKNINKKKAKSFERYKDTNIEHYLVDICGLVPSGAKGIIFKKWSTYKELPTDSYFYKLFGIDWGGADPHTFTELNFDKKQKRVYIKEHLYRDSEDFRIPDFMELVKTINPENYEVVADSARRDLRNEFSDNGINIIKADKTKIKDDFRKDVVEMLKQYDMYIHEDSENAIYEFSNYKWAINAATKEPIGKPEDKNNHIIDGCCYATRYYHTNYAWTYNKDK